MSPPQLFAVKASRYITHLKHLLNAEGAVNQFLGRVNLLEEKLGPILFQLSPQWHINAERLRNFVAILPEGQRYVFEFRHHSWYTEEIFQILEEGGCGFCIHDQRDAPSPEKITARFAYVRLHCSPTTEGGHYTTQELAKWATKLVDWETQGIEIYCYFNNDWEGYAVNNALELKKLVEERRSKGYSY